MLRIKGLAVVAENKEILKGVDLVIKPNELVAVMGPNGSGKSTLAYTLAGHPAYRVTRGKVSLDGKDLLKLTADKRAREGLFLAFQYPVTVTGVGISNFLRLAYSEVKGKKMAPFKFRELLQAQARKLKIRSELLERSLNEGFSGGEKKKLEILQLSVLAPKYAILDETDSGLDIDALKVVARGVNRIRKDNPKMGAMVITHYQRILRYIRPDRVVVIKGGRIVKEGKGELVKELEEKGYGEI